MNVNLEGSARRDILDFDAEGLTQMADEPLCDELLEYYEAKGGRTHWPMLRHPLVYDIPYSGLGGLANRRLEAKKKAVEQAMATGSTEHAVWMHERPWRLWAFLNLVVGIDPDSGNPEECPSLWTMPQKTRMLVMHIWTDSENISAYRPWWEALWAPNSPDRKPGEVVADDSGRDLWKGLPEEFTVYKGGDPNGESFLSWTLSRKTAEFFAQRFIPVGGKPRKVIERQMNRSQVFAVMGDRGEQEVLALP